MLANFTPVDVAALIADIGTANTNSQADTIDLGGGTFTLTAVNNPANGLPVIGEDGGNALTIQNGTIRRDTSGGTPQFRILHVGIDAELTILNSTISGGGIFNYSSTVTITDSTISGNSATNGGGIWSNTNLMGTQTTTISNSTISGNTAGTQGGGIFNSDGLTVIRNSTISDNQAAANSGSGVASTGNASTRTDVLSSTIGGTAANAGNIISGNNQYGVFIGGSGSGGNRVEGNFVGTDISGTLDRGNTRSGVYITNSPDNTVGGTAAGAGNLISGNDRFGVYITRGDSTGNRVQGNNIGLQTDGSTALGNGLSGVLISQAAANNTVGGTTGGAENVISANGDRGVQIGGSSGNVVQGNLIGTDAAGGSARGNSDSGVYISNAANNTIGGTTAAAENVISANGLYGVQIVNAGSTGNRVQSNLIGLDAAGSSDLGNTRSGVLISAAGGNTVGGDAATAGNVISGNDEHGVFLGGGAATSNRVQGNLIGTDVTGMLDRGNSTHGVYIQNAPSNTVGGGAAGVGNVISGNNRFGVYIFRSGASGNLVQGNAVGVNAAGTAALGNARSGVLISDAPDNTVGGSAVGEGNLISGNAHHGVFLENAGTTGTRVEGNRIGTDGAGTSDIGNGRNGVFINGASDNMIGGATTAEGNMIGFNTLDGVRVQGSATGNAITRNQIFSNVLLGIDLGGDGATANDANDPDSGANDLQNFPVITLAELAGNSLTIDYAVPSTTGNSAYDLSIEFFLTDADDEEGQFTIGGDDYPAGNATATKQVVLDVTGLGLSPGDRIVATATDANGNTSEFSLFFTIVNPPPPSPAAVDAVFAKPA